MDFPDTFDFSVVSNSQAHKQAGNSIVVNVLVEILKKIADMSQSKKTIANRSRYKYSSRIRHIIPINFGNIAINGL